VFKVHYCPTCGQFTPCYGFCRHLLQVVQCASCSSKGPPQKGSAYLAAVDGKWATK
jgi:hypothetical protein